MKEILIAGIILGAIVFFGPWPELLDILKIIAMIAVIGLVYNSNLIINELRETNNHLNEMKDIR